MTHVLSASSRGGLLFFLNTHANQFASAHFRFTAAPRPANCLPAVLNDAATFQFSFPPIEVQRAMHNSPIDYTLNSLTQIAATDFVFESQKQEIDYVLSTVGGRSAHGEQTIEILIVLGAARYDETSFARLKIGKAKLAHARVLGHTRNWIAGKRRRRSEKIRYEPLTCQIARGWVRRFIDRRSQRLQSFGRDRMPQRGEIFLPFGFGGKIDRRDMPNALAIKPKFNSERPLPDAPCDFDGECIGLDFVRSPLNEVGQTHGMFFQDVSEFVGEKKYNRVSEIAVRAICDGSFLTRIIGNTECLKNGQQRSPRRQFRFAKKHADIIAHGGAVARVEVEPGACGAEIGIEAQRKRRQINRAAIAVKLEWISTWCGNGNFDFDRVERGSFRVSELRENCLAIFGSDLFAKSSGVGLELFSRIKPRHILRERDVANERERERKRETFPHRRLLSLEEIDGGLATGWWSSALI
jgi:hypothetical protein